MAGQGTSPIRAEKGAAPGRADAAGSAPAPGDQEACRLSWPGISLRTEAEEAPVGEASRLPAGAISHVVAADLGTGGVLPTSVGLCLTEQDARSRAVRRHKEGLSH